MLKLRDIKLEDLDFLHNIENNQENMIYGDYHEPYSMDVLQEYIANASTPLFISSQYRYVIDNDEIAVGFLDLFEYDAQDESAFLGIILDLAFRGQALAKNALVLLEREVLNKWGIKILRAKVFFDNTVSISLFENLGYRVVEKSLEKDCKGLIKTTLILEKKIK